MLTWHKNALLDTSTQQHFGFYSQGSKTLSSETRGGRTPPPCLPSGLLKMLWADEAKLGSWIKKHRDEQTFPASKQVVCHEEGIGNFFKH